MGEGSLYLIDGLFSQADDSALRFHETTRLSAQEVERTERAVQRRVLRLFVRRGLIEDYVAADMLTWQAAGGFSINAAVRVEGRDRAGRERLIRYCARPPFALERLTIERVRTPILADDARAGAEVRRVLYRLPRATPDGRTVLALSPIEFLQAPAHLIPPPRVHRHRYHGVLAPHARLRPAITAWAQQAVAPEPAPAVPTPSSPDFDTAAPASRRATPPAAPSSPPSAAPLNLSAPRSKWARLLARIYEVLPLLCPACGGELRINAFLTPPEPVTAILDPSACPPVHRRSRPPAPLPSSPSRSTSAAPSSTSIRRPRSTRPIPNRPRVRVRPTPSDVKR